MPSTFRWARFTALAAAAALAAGLVATLIHAMDPKGLALALLHEADGHLEPGSPPARGRRPVVAAALFTRTLIGLVVATMGSTAVSVAWFAPLLASDSSTAGIGILFGLLVPGGVVVLVLGGEAWWLARFRPRSPWSDWGPQPRQ